MGSGRLFSAKVLVRDIRPPKPTFLPSDYPDLTDKVVIVTGANTGIGFEAARILTSKNCHVIIAVRSQTKAEDTIKKILEALGENDGNPIGKIDYVTIDLSDLTTIKNAADQVFAKTEKLNIVIHNAGVALRYPATTAQNHEFHFGVNAIGPYLFQKHLDPLFLKPNTTFKRVVWVSSALHIFSPPNGGIDWDDINLERSRVTSYGYAQSKAADAILAGVWSQHHQAEVDAQNIVSVSVHPGSINTEIFRDLPGFIRKTLSLFLYGAEYGAYSELFAALSPTLTIKDNGAYIIPWGVIGDARDDVRESISNGNGEKLWNYLDEVTADY